MKTEAITKNETIQSLYQKINDKSQFIKDVAKDLDKKPGSLQNHWFSRFFSVPESHEDRVIEMLEDAIEKQNSTSNE